MAARFIAIWLPGLMPDWMIRRRPELKEVPFVFAALDRGRMLITSASSAARKKGIRAGMVVADARAVLPALEVFDDLPDVAARLLREFATWALRYTPVCAVDAPGGLILDTSGCTHLWGGERTYMDDLTARLGKGGYEVRAAMADTVGAAWAVSRYGRPGTIVPVGGVRQAIEALSPVALRLDAVVAARLDKLGLYQICNFIDMPRSALRRRFGEGLLLRLGQALGTEPEEIVPIEPVQPFQERLPSLEPIRTATGIEIALSRLLQVLCARLAREGKGLRRAVFRGYRIDGDVQQIDIGTGRASRDEAHLFRLFALKIDTMEPDLGFELFVLEAPLVEPMPVAQDTLWDDLRQSDQLVLARLLDKIAGKVGEEAIHRYLPAEHYWPERSITEAASATEQPATPWRTDRPRPVLLLRDPERIEVMVPIPDYPPLLFHYKGRMHKVARADGPERIEQEWWIEDGQHRDYYCVEDDAGARYWIFRLGHYAEGEPRWFLHGFFA